MENFFVGIFMIIIVLTIISGGLSAPTATNTPITSATQSTPVKNQETPISQNPTQNSTIQTVGKEGEIVVESSSLPSGLFIQSSSTRATFLEIQISARGSDIDVQRIKVNLGSSTAGSNFSHKVASRIYILGNGYNVLASSLLNANTVNRESVGGTNIYTITLTNFHLSVPKDTTRILSVAFDIYPVIDSIYRTSYTVSIDANGVRAIDGANINHTAPKSTISRYQTVVE
ncbi:MAG: hypothetical protein WA051_01380 [Minisyncoccia bacterium]